MMKSHKDQKLTPRMRKGLILLARGDNLSYAHTCVGRPSKQRLAKYGFAEYVTAKDWDGPMRITDKGWRALGLEPGDKVPD